jgi:hypothetical protein
MLSLTAAGPATLVASLSCCPTILLFEELSLVCWQRFNKSDFRKEVERDAGPTFPTQVFQCLVEIATANSLIFARSRPAHPSSLEHLSVAVERERNVLFDILGCGGTPKAHTGKHYHMYTDLYTLLRLIRTNRGEAKHLEYKRWVPRMNRWNIEMDMLHFSDVKEVSQ